MSGALVWTAAAAPDPPYGVVPLCATLVGLVVAIGAWVAGDGRPDWPRVWAIGNILGSAVGVLILLVLTFLEVT